MFKSSIGHFYFLDIHIIPEQLSLSWYSNLCRASDGGGRVDTGSVVGKQLSWGGWRSVQQQQQQWCRKIQQLPLRGMLINNVHKCKNPQINCDPWTEGVYQGSYTLKEVCLAQNSYFLPEMELPWQNFHTKWQVFKKTAQWKLSNFPLWYFFEKRVFWNLCIYSILDKYKQLPLSTFHHKDKDLPDILA